MKFWIQYIGISFYTYHIVKLIYFLDLLAGSLIMLQVTTLTRNGEYIFIWSGGPGAIFYRDLYKRLSIGIIFSVEINWETCGLILWAKKCLSLLLSLISLNCISNLWENTSYSFIFLEGLHSEACLQGVRDLLLRRESLRKRLLWHTGKMGRKSGDWWMLLSGSS